MAEPEYVRVDPQKLSDIFAGMTEQEMMELSDALEDAMDGAPGGPIKELVERKEAEMN